MFVFVFGTCWSVFVCLFVCLGCDLNVFIFRTAPSSVPRSRSLEAKQRAQHSQVLLLTESDPQLEQPTITCDRSQECEPIQEQI